MVRNHTQELLMGPQHRRSCDRCHAQKMRCVKGNSPHDDRCLRCAKQGALCQYSPRVRRRAERTPETAATSPSSSSTTSSQPLGPHHADYASHDPLFSAGADAFPVDHTAMPTPDCLAPWGAVWSPSTFNNMELGQLPAMGLFDLPAMNVMAELDTSPLSVADSVRELADLNVRLFDHSCTLPTQPSGQGGRGRLFAIDQTFTLTKTLITILKRLYAYLDESGPESRPIDQATALLILSCHCRLMDLYESIFGGIQSCSQNPQLTPPEAESGLTLPPLRFGSYSAPELQPLPSLSTVAMHMTVVLMISAQLCKQLRETIGAGMGRVEGQPISIFDDATQQTLRQRWGALGEKISSTQQSLMLFSVTSVTG
ncbi:hypothetical protein BDV95DRAFT_300101 [Massariosphaeria phaeospora]|uniref:Zn(2)-C6 fungal-type domain-containing protein n=1 Tax=Massariosphaeria phaeospora TaxID=100035 RepID=A0A7C8MC70_9PLEO|nr:hypothetical protein BDV95DRAFT_300101 [Massariosphaeria phaeospora]